VTRKSLLIFSWAVTTLASYWLSGLPFYLTLFFLVSTVGAIKHDQIKSPIHGTPTRPNTWRECEGPLRSTSSFSSRCFSSLACSSSVFSRSDGVPRDSNLSSFTVTSKSLSFLSMGPLSSSSSSGYISINAVIHRVILPLITYKFGKIAQFLNYTAFIYCYILPAMPASSIASNSLRNEWWFCTISW